MFDYAVSDIFKFETRDVTSFMMYKLHLGDKIKDSFKYLADKLGVQELPKNLSDLKWSEGKNYNWAFVKHDKVTFGIRQYHNHYTIFSKREKGTDDWNAKFAIYTFHTDREKLTDDQKDERVEDWTLDLNKHIKDLFKMAAEDQLWALWNNLMFKRPDYIDVACVWSGGQDDISKIDLFNFACEEIFQKFLEVFSQIDMLEVVKKTKVGDKLGEYTVTAVKKTVKNEYYHDAGISWKSDREEKWNDVYSLTRWYFSEMFPKGFMLK